MHTWPIECLLAVASRWTNQCFILPRQVWYQIHPPRRNGRDGSLGGRCAKSEIGTWNQVHTTAAVSSNCVTTTRLPVHMLHFVAPLATPSATLLGGVADRVTDSVARRERKRVHSHSLTRHRNSIQSMLRVWWNCKGVILWEPLPSNTIFTGDSYCIPGKEDKIFFFLYDSACLQVATATQKVLQCFG